MCDELQKRAGATRLPAPSRADRDARGPNSERERARGGSHPSPPPARPLHFFAPLHRGPRLGIKPPTTNPTIPSPLSSPASLARAAAPAGRTGGKAAVSRRRGWW
uniref:Uncharacterized protein n=1 Tax=Oryza glumipatula TaxID=40148 RepID=A0A0D9YYB4_9ORYZ